MFFINIYIFIYFCTRNLKIYYSYRLSSMVIIYTAWKYIYRMVIISALIAIQVENVTKVQKTFFLESFPPKIPKKMIFELPRI